MTRSCTCHPSEAPVRCPQKYAYSECVETAKRILDRYGDGSLQPEELAVWLRERESVWIWGME
jgi:hypothetical protein